MRLVGWFFGIALIAVIGATLWLAVGSSPSRPQVSGPGTDLVDQLRDYYARAERLENEIRMFRQKKENHQAEQNELAALRDSIAAVRSQIEITADQGAPPAFPNEKKSGRLDKLPIKPAWILVGIAFFILLGFAFILKNRVFGQTHQPRPAFTPPSMPALTPSREQPVRQQAPPAPAAPPAPEPAAPPPPPPPPKPAPKPAPSPSSKAGSIHEQILELHNQGLSVKEISAQLKIEQDQITLALKVHGK